MKHTLNPILLCLTLFLFSVDSLYAFGARRPSPPNVPIQPTEPVDEKTAEEETRKEAEREARRKAAAKLAVDLGLNFAIVYAKQDPRYSGVLNALRINSAQDIRNFIEGNTSGRNFGNIIARLAFMAALDGERGQDILDRLGIGSEQELRDFINSRPGGSEFETLLELALGEAMNNPKYTKWLEAMKISDVQDIRNLLRGTDRAGNLMSLVLMIGMHVVENDEELSKYAPYIRVALTTLGLIQGMDGSGSLPGSEDDIINLGYFNGMTVGEAKAVQSLK